MSDTVSKSEFAALIGVTPGRVSQYLKQGRISTAAVAGEGRNARIRVELAKADLRISLDVGQRFGNGLTTRLDAAQPATRSSNQRAEPPLASGIDQEIKEQKLEQIRRANRNAAIAAAIARGELMKTEDAKAEMTRIGLNMLAQMEGKLPDVASAIAAEYKLPQRDVLHFLRKKFLEVRRVRSEQIKQIAETIPAFVETAIIETGDEL
jgi:hypothetical protein